MNLKIVYASVGDAFALLRPQKTLVSPDFELVVLAYEEALKRGWDTEYSIASHGLKHIVSVFDCSLDEFSSILNDAEVSRDRHSQRLAGQLTLPFDVRWAA